MQVGIVEVVIVVVVLSEGEFVDLSLALSA